MAITKWSFDDKKCKQSPARCGKFAFTLGGRFPRESVGSTNAFPASPDYSNSGNVTELYLRNDGRSSAGSSDIKSGGIHDTDFFGATYGTSQPNNIYSWNQGAHYAKITFKFDGFVRLKLRITISDSYSWQSGEERETVELHKYDSSGNLVDTVIKHAFAMSGETVYEIEKYFNVSASDYLIFKTYKYKGTTIPLTVDESDTYVPPSFVTIEPICYKFPSS